MILRHAAAIQRKAAAIQHSQGNWVMGKEPSLGKKTLRSYQFIDSYEIFCKIFSYRMHIFYPVA